MLWILLSILFLQAKEVALTFDDAPKGNTPHFNSLDRTRAFVKKLKDLQVPRAMIFANPCRGKSPEHTINQLKLYVDAGHIIANHTCDHPRFDDVGFESFSNSTKMADSYLAPLMSGQKFFRYPYLNEGKDPILRDQMREWLSKNQYRNGMVSIDNDDYHFSYKINKAKELGKKIDYKVLEKEFVTHIMGALEFYDALALKHLGYSPKHVMLLHEMDATLLFLDALVQEMRKRGWTIIGSDEAFKDPLYLEQPKNTYANNGILPQIVFERTQKKEGYFVFEELDRKLDQILDLD